MIILSIIIAIAILVIPLLAWFEVKQAIKKIVLNG